MAKDTVDQGHRFPDAITPEQLVFALANTPELFQLVIDTNGLAAVNLPDGFVTDRYAISGGTLFLIGPDGQIVALLAGAENAYILQFDGIPVAATELTNAVEALGDWDQLGDIPRMSVTQMLDLGEARPGTGEQEPVNVGDPLIGLEYNPLLPPTDYPPELQLDRRFFGDDLLDDDDDGVPEPGENVVRLTGLPITRETDAPVDLRPATFIEFNLEQADIGEAVSLVTLQVTGLPLGTTTNLGQITASGGVATLSFSGSEADFNALVLTFPTDFSTQSRNDAPTGPLQATIAIETTFLGSAQLEFPIAVLAEGDAIIDATGPDTVLDETDAPTSLKPSDLLAPQVTDIDGSEDYETLELIIQGLPAGSTLASLGLVVPAGVVAVVTPALNGSTTLTISMNSDQVADIQAAYDAIELTLPTDFSTESRTDLRFADALPLTLTLNIQTDEDVTAAVDTPTDGTVTATRVVDIGAEGDLQLSGPGAIALDENDAPGDTDEDSTPTTPLDLRPADAVTGQPTDIDGSESISTVDVVINGLPSNTQYSTDGGATFQTAPTGAVFTLNGLTFAQYQNLIVRLPDDFSTTTPLTGTATFTTNEAILAGETDAGPDDGVETGTFTITVNSEQDVEITSADITVIEDLGAPIPLNLDIDITDIDGSESITSITLDFANLPSGNTVLSDGTVLNAGNTQWTGDLATLQSLAVTSLPTHYSGVITITVTVDTDEGDPTVAVESFDLNVTPVAEPTIVLSVDDSTPNVDERGPDNYLVDEDTSFLLLIDAETPDQDGSEALTQIVIENVPTGWIANTGGVVDLALFEQGSAQVDSATISGTTLTITFVAGVTDFDGAIRVAPLANDDRDVETIVGGDLTATVTSLDQAPPLPSDMQTATDSVDVDVDAIVDGLNVTTNDVTVNENRNGRRRIDVDISGTALEDNDGSETISALDLTITVATASDVFDPSDTAQLELRVSDPALAGFVIITQTGATADSVSYSLTPAVGATQAQYSAALESLQTVVPQHFSGVLTLDGTLAWNETTTGDVEDDTSDNFNTGVFQISQTVNPLAEADLTASVFVLTAAEVASGSPVSVSASVEDGSIAGSEILTLLESTDDGSGPGQVSVFVGLNAQTPDTDGSEELSTLVIANVPTDWIADFLTGTTVDPSAFFSADGTVALDPSELAKIDTATYDATTGELTITFVPDVTSFEGSIQLNPTLYEDYDVDRQNSDPFTSAGDFFGDDLTITLTTQDDNTVTTDDQVSDASFDVDVDPVNNIAVILTLPEGNEGEIDAAGGVWQIPFEPIIQDQDGSEQVTAVVLRNVPAGVTIYVPDPANPGGPKILALLTEVDTPTGFNTWSLENGGWTGAEARGIPLHFAGPVSATVEVVTTEADGGGTRVTPLTDQLYIDPVIDGGDPSESYTTAEDTAVFFPIDGNLIDNPTNSPGSPEAILDVVIITNVIPDSGGRVPRFFDGPPDPLGTNEIASTRITADGTLRLTVAEASNLWVVPGQDSNEDFEFGVSLIYFETLDPTQQIAVDTGTATLTVTGVADTPIITTQDETAYTGAINAEFDPGGTTDSRQNSDLIYGYAGFSSAPFLLDSRLLDSVIQNGVTSDQQDETFTTAVTPLSGVMTEILVPQGDPNADFDGSETIYYLITGVDPATSFANATPLDASGESYLVTESQLANLQFVPTGVTEVTYYNPTFTAIVTENDADLSSLSGLTPEEVIQQIDNLPGGAAVSEDISIVVVPDPGGGPDPCEDDQRLPLPTLELVGSGDEDTEIAFKIKITPVPPFYDSIDDLVNLPNGVTGSFGLGIDLPPGSTLSSDPPGAVLFDPVTGQYAIDLSVLGVDPADPTQTLGSILFTPPEHESSPAPFPPDDTFGPDDPYDGLDSLDYSMILVNTTCGTTQDGTASFAITINPVVDGPQIVVLGPNSVLEDTAFLPNIEIQGIDPGERPVGDIVIELDDTNGGQLLDGDGNPIPGTPVAGGRVQYTVTQDQLPTLQITANEHYSGPLEYSITATSEDLDGSTLSNTVTRTLTIIPVADVPFFDFDQTPTDPDTGQPFVDLSGPTPVITIIEDVPFTLGSVLTADSPDQDGSEEVTLVLSGVPDYLIVTGPSSGFINNGDGTYTISDDAFDQVQFVLRDEHARTPDGLDNTLPSEIPLTLTVNTFEIANSDSNSGSVDFVVRVRPDADVPTVTASVTPDTGVEDDATVYTLDISGTTPDPHETMEFQITVPPGGRIFVDGVEQPVVGGVVTISAGTGLLNPGGDTVFAPVGVVTFDPPLDFAGDVTLEVVEVTTDTALTGGFSDSETSAPADLDLTITPSLDLDLTVDPDPDSAAQTGTPILVELGIDAIVTDTLGIETLDEVVVSFNNPLPPGATVSDGVLSADRQTLTLSRGALTSAEFTALVAAVTVLLPGDFSGAVAGTVIATTNHGTSSPVPFGFDVNDQPDVSGPVDVTSTDPVFFITNAELLANSSDTDALSIGNVTSDDPTNVTIDIQAGGVQITVPDGYVGTPVLTYDVIDSGTPPASAQATANLDIDTLQMEATGTTITDPTGAPRDLLDDVTGAVGGNDIARGTAGNDGVVWSTTSPYSEIEGFSLLGGDDFVDLSGSSNGYSVDLGADDDWAIGSTGNDTLNGGAGSDILDGGQGVDNLTGGTGSDIFVMTDLTMSDVITDYEGPAGGDQIDLTALVNVAPGDIGTEVTYDNSNGELDVRGTLVATVNAAGGGFTNEVEVIFNDANGAQQTAVI